MTDEPRRPVPLFHRLYGDGLAVLPRAIVVLHDVTAERSWHGTAMVERGPSLLARLLCSALGFPGSAENLQLSVTMRRAGDGEIWLRKFNDAPLNSRLQPGPRPGTISERLGPLAAHSRLDCDASGVAQVLVGLTAFGVPVPRLLWPRVEVREATLGEHTYTFAMRTRFPWGGLLVHYRGSLDIP